MILVTKKELEEELVIHFWDMQKQKTNTRINILRQRFVISYILRYKIMYMDWQWLKKIKKIMYTNGHCLKKHLLIDNPSDLDQIEIQLEIKHVPCYIPKVRKLYLEKGYLR